MNTNENVIYEAPQVEVVEVEVEKGFAQSLNYERNPRMPYGDDEEEWF